MKKQTFILFISDIILITMILISCQLPVRSQSNKEKKEPQNNEHHRSNSSNSDSSILAQWAQTVSIGQDDSWFNSVSIDSSGNIYAAGQIDGIVTYNFGNGVTATGTYSNENILLVKYDSSGITQWARTVSTGPRYSSFNSVAVDSVGNIYAAGHINGTETYGFGNDIIASGVHSGSNILVVKYDSSGTVQWAQTVFAGTGYSRFNSIAVDSSGNIYAAGLIDGNETYNFGNGVTATGTSSHDNILLVKYNSLGIAQWAQTVSTGAEISYFNSVTVNTSGNIYAAGQINGTGTYNFGNGVTATGTNSKGNILIVKYDISGTAQWAQTVSAGTGYSAFNSVVVDFSGNIYAAGHINGTETYGFGNDISATGVSILNILLVKYDSSGTAQWAQTVSGTTDSCYDSVAVDSSGNIYTAGHINGIGTFVFGNSVTATGTYAGPYSFGQNIILVKYDSSGTAQWAQTILIGLDDSWFNAVTIDSSGNIYAAGGIDGTGTFNFGNSATATGTNLSGENILLVKYK